MASSRVCVGANGYDFDGSDSAALAAPHVSASISDTVVAGKASSFHFSPWKINLTRFQRLFPARQLPDQFDLSIAIRLPVRVEHLVEPHCRLIQNVGVPPGIPGIVGLCLARNKP